MKAPQRVRCSYVRSLGATTEADLTAPRLPPILGYLLEEPQEGQPLVVFQKSGKRAMTTSPIERIDRAEALLDVTTKHSVYRVRYLPETGQ